MRNLRPFVMILMSLGIGLAAMTVAAQWLRDRGLQQTRAVLVAAHDVAAGIRLDRSMLQVVHWPNDAVLAPALAQLEEAEGRITTSLVTPYPPGIPLLIPGEVFNRKIVEYLRFSREFNTQCPGFETDIHGLVSHVDEQGKTHLFADCVKR